MEIVGSRPIPPFLWLPFLLHTQIKYRLKFSKQKKIDRRTAIENEICLTKPEPCWPGWLGCGFGFYWDIWMRQRGASLRWRWCGCWQWGRGKVDITSRLDPSIAHASPQNTWISRHRLPECVHCVLEVLIQNLVTYPQWSSYAKMVFAVKSNGIVS